MERYVKQSRVAKEKYCRLMELVWNVKSSLGNKTNILVVQTSASQTRSSNLMVFAKDAKSIQGNRIQLLVKLTLVPIVK